MTQKRRAYIALGSNLGNRREYLREAVQNLEGVTQVSGLYETDPVGYDDQGPFLNLVVELETELTPRQLLEVCQQGEENAKRERLIVNGPRTLDMDLLWVDNKEGTASEEVNDIDLIVPHPRMFERSFVMIPLNDVNQEIPADWIAANFKKADEGGAFPGVYPVGSLELENPKPLEFLTTKESLAKTATSIRDSGKTIGLVPTMGALHQGHLELIKRSIRENDATIVTLFVNPAQFNDPADFQSYPNTDERDREFLEELAPDFIFKPEQEEIYPEPPLANIQFQPLTSELEGKHRPGHLEGVCLIVLKLLNIAGPCSVYFGEKDYQQLMLARHMAKELDLPVNVVGCPTVRDHDGLALSSRNQLLNQTEREAALLLHIALDEGKQLVKSGKTAAKEIVRKISRKIKAHPKIKVEYISIRDTETFREQEEISSPVRILLAAKVGKIRLIDNIAVEPSLSQQKEQKAQ